MGDVSAQTFARKGDTQVSTESPEEKMKRLEKYIKKTTRKNYLDEHRDNLIEFMAIEHGLIGKLIAKNVITLIESHDIEGTGGAERNPANKNKTMLDIIRKIDDRKYLNFLELLAQYQEDLVIEYLTEGNWVKNADLR